MPDWWTMRRLGMFVHTNVATVPAWAPIGQYAEWYRSHLGDDVDDVVLHPQPLVEVLAHHRDRWGHIDAYDDFVALLTFDEFDAESWARLACDSGAGYTIFVAKHHDGWAWWDSPNSKRRLTDDGPGRNVLAEYAAAAERNDLVFGTYYSLLDWADDRYPSDVYVTDVLHRDVLDLVERYGTSVLWGDGHWGHDAGHWRTRELLDAVRRVDPDMVVNDRWWASSHDVPDGAPAIVRTFEYACPDGIVDAPWELTRGIGHSFGHNGAERTEHHMTGHEIVDLYTEVVAKGGNLLLNVGPAADGTIPELQATPLREAGSWIRRFDHVLAGSRPWTRWGDADTRFVRGADDGDSDGDAVYAIDVTGRGRLSGFDPATQRIVSVERIGGVGGDDDGDEVDTSVPFEYRDDGVRLFDPPRSRARTSHDDGVGVGVYRLRIDTLDRPVELFERVPDEPLALAPLLADARSGDIVQLGDGVYAGPATVPDGVVLRGLGAGRTVVRTTASAGIRPDGPAITVERDGRVEHLCVEGPASRADPVAPVLVALAGPSASMLGCTVRGHVDVRADDVVLRAVKGRGLVATNADRLSVSRCSFAGNRWDVGVHLIGGGGQFVESSDFVDHLCAIRATATTGTEIRHNTISGRWWGVHLDGTEDAHVHGNHVRITMRAVAVDGGINATVDGNAAIGGDSGCLVENGAAHCTVSGNHWESCRVGLLAWSATDLHHHDNVSVDLHDPDNALVEGP